MALAALLAACGGGYQALTDSEVAVTVARQKVIVAAPDGFCFDRRSTDVNSKGAFLLAGDCLLTADAEPDGPGSGAFLTVNVSNSGVPDGLDALEAFFGTELGAATLGKSGEPDKVEVLESRVEGDILFVKVRDSGDQPVPGAAPVFWRGFFEAADRLVGVSVIGFVGASVPDGRAQDYIRGFAERTQAANPAVPDSDPAGDSAAPPPETEA